jgi:hypothetical protein
MLGCASTQSVALFTGPGRPTPQTYECPEEAILKSSRIVIVTLLHRLGTVGWFSFFTLLTNTRANLGIGKACPLGLAPELRGVSTSFVPDTPLLLVRENEN